MIRFVQFFLRLSSRRLKFGINITCFSNDIECDFKADKINEILVT